MAVLKGSMPAIRDLEFVSLALGKVEGKYIAPFKKRHICTCARTHLRVHMVGAVVLISTKYKIVVI